MQMERRRHSPWHAIIEDNSELVLRMFHNGSRLVDICDMLQRILPEHRLYGQSLTPFLKRHGLTARGPGRPRSDKTARTRALADADPRRLKHRRAQTEACLSRFRRTIAVLVAEGAACTDVHHELQQLMQPSRPISSVVDRWLRHNCLTSRFQQRIRDCAQSVG